MALLNGISPSDMKIESSSVLFGTWSFPIAPCDVFGKLVTKTNSHMTQHLTSRVKYLSVLKANCVVILWNTIGSLVYWRNVFKGIKKLYHHESFIVVWDVIDAHIWSSFLPVIYVKNPLTKM